MAPSPARPPRFSPSPPKAVGRPKGGRPLKSAFLTPGQITRAAEVGCSNKEIAILARLSHDTLVVRFRNELEYGRALRKWTILSKQFEGAEAMNVTMLIWLGKNELGQSDHNTSEEFTYDLNTLAGDELERLAAGQPLKKIVAGRKRSSRL